MTPFMRVARPDIPELWPLTADAEPGVYRSRYKIRGRHMYYAIDDRGDLIDCRRARADETDAEVVSSLRAAYRERCLPRRLRIVRDDHPTPGAASAFSGWRPSRLARQHGPVPHQ
jgi:hypothetical protein